MSRKNDEVSSLSHTRWDCKYHIVFTPKYRRKAIYAKLRADIGKYVRRCCEYKGVEIIEAHAMPITYTCLYAYRRSWLCPASWGI